MTQDTTREEAATPARRTRGPAKPFPVVAFEDALVLAEGILEHGIGGTMQRLTLLDKLGRSPSSSRTRSLITSSSRYGLTTGSYNAQTLKATDDARIVLSSSTTPRALLETKLQLAISRFPVFADLYEKLLGQRLPDRLVVADQLVQSGVSPDDGESASDILIANLRHLGLIRDITGSDHVIAVDEASEQQPVMTDTSQSMSSTISAGVAPVAPQPPSSSGPLTPSVHLDIQIHIDSSATPEQIDQIFASMAKYLYDRS